MEKVQKFASFINLWTLQKVELVEFNNLTEHLS